VALFAVGEWIPVVHLVQFALDLGLPPLDADRLVLFLGLGNLGLRIPLNALADRVGRSRVFMGSALAYAGLDLCMPLFQRSYASLCVFAVLAGGCYGAVNSLLTTIPGDYVGPHLMRQATGLSIAALGVGMVSGPVIAGEVYDRTGSYDVVWVVAALCMAASAVTLAVPASVFGCAPRSQRRADANWNGTARTGTAATARSASAALTHERAEVKIADATMTAAAT